MTEVEFDVMIDRRETDRDGNNLLVPEYRSKMALRDSCVGSVNDVPLPAGDISIGPVLFERKTPPDFAQSVTDSDRNIYTQIEKMGQVIEEATEVDHSYILIEGDSADFSDLTHTDIAPKSLRGVVSSVMARAGVPILFCSNRDLLVDYSLRIARKHSTSSVSSSMHSGSVDVKEEVPKRVAGVLPGVGAKTAESIYEEFPTVESLVEASEEELRGIEGVGEKRAEDIRQSLS